MRTLESKPWALIFDMDGTLLDTEPLYSTATQRILDPYGAEYTLALKQQCMGGNARRSARIIIDYLGLPLTPEEFLSRRELHLLKLFANTPEVAGAANFIWQVSKSGIPFGVATSSYRHLYRVKLANKPWSNLFHQVVCGDHPNLRQGKPAPDIFLLCAEALGVDPNQCIAFEDSRNGVAAARKAGMQVIAINSPYVEEGALDEAQRIVDHYDELLPLLSRWAS